MAHLELAIGHFTLEDLFDFMANFILDKIVEQVYRSPKEQAAKNRALKQANIDVENAIEEMRQEFENHPVTKELDGGVTATNISRTLLGKKGPQNLYAFIGFRKGTDPLEPIRKMFADPELMRTKVEFLRKDYQRGSLTITYVFKVKKPIIPSSVLKQTAVPWGEGWSWVEKIETDIPGFAYFLSKFGEKTSRSGGGVQVDEDEEEPLRSSEFKPPRNGYLISIFKTFTQKVKSARSQ